MAVWDILNNREGGQMRIESSVTSVSWIPSEAISGLIRVPVDLGVGRYDDPLPDHIEDLERLRAEDRFRFANQLRAWIEVVDGRVIDAGYSGGGLIGSTTVSLGVGSVTIPAFETPTLQIVRKTGTSAAPTIMNRGKREF